PRSRRPCRNASVRSILLEAEAPKNNPIRGTFFGCCDSTGKLRAKTIATDAKQKTLLIIEILTAFCLLAAPALCSRLSPDHPIRPVKHIRRNRQADLLCGFQIDHQLELHRPLHREVSGLRTLENLVHVSSGTTVLVGEAGSIRHQATSIHGLGTPVHRWQSVFYCEVQNQSVVSIHEWV